jgi:hypothetical protein
VAFLLALTGEDGPAPTWASGELPDLPEDRLVTVRAYRAWAERAGSQAAAFAGEPGWTPARRFGRIFQRLALPGFARAQRFELLATLAAAGLYELEADSLHIGGEDDDTTLAAKRVLSSGETMLLERRARELAEACGVPLAALDRGLAEWGAPGEAGGAGGAGGPPSPDPDDTIRAALRLP